MNAYRAQRVGSALAVSLVTLMGPGLEHVDRHAQRADRIDHQQGLAQGQSAMVLRERAGARVDLDVIAFVEVVNPDGIPGSGDERFRTLGSGGTQLVPGSADARKDRLDTVIRTALVIKF